MCKLQLKCIMLAVLACCTVAPSQGQSVAQKSHQIASSSDVECNGSSSGIGKDGRLQTTAPRSGGAGRLGALGMFYLALAFLGNAAVFVAGYLLISARRKDRDAPYLVLGGAGYALLIAAAFGLILLSS